MNLMSAMSTSLLIAVVLVVFFAIYLPRIINLFWGSKKLPPEMHDFSRLLKHKIIQFGGLFGARRPGRSMTDLDNCSATEKTFRLRLEDLRKKEAITEETREIERVIALIALAKRRDPSALEKIAKDVRDILKTKVEKKEVQLALSSLVEESAFVQGHLLAGRTSYDRLFLILVVKILVDKLLVQAEKGKGDLLESLATKCYVNRFFVMKALEYLLLKNNILIEGHLKRNLFDPSIERTSYLAEMEARTLRLAVMKLMRRKNSSEFMGPEEFNNHLKTEITALFLEYNLFKKKAADEQEKTKEGKTGDSGLPHDEKKMDLNEARKTLGVDEGAGRTQVKIAFRKMALKFHPDKQLKGTEHTKTRIMVNLRFVRLKAAYEFLLKTFLKK